MATTIFVGDRADVVAAIAALGGVDVSLAPPVHLVRTRLDTFDGALHAAGLGLEMRTEAGDGPPRHALVLSGGGGADAHVPLAEGLAPDGQLALDRVPAGPLRARLLAVAHGRALLPQLTVSSTRRAGARNTAAGAPKVVVNLDTDVATTPGLLRYDRLPALACVVEVRDQPGGTKAAASVRNALRRLELDRDDRDLLEAVATGAGIEVTGWRGPSQPALDRHAAALAGFRAVLRSFAAAMESNWAGTVAHRDSEFLHDLRISVRQTRSVLTQSRRVLPAEVRREQRAAFAWLGEVTSPARDLDVYVEGWEALLSPLTPREAAALDPLLEHLAVERIAAQAAVSEALCSERARALRARWWEWLDTPDGEVGGGKDAHKRLGVIAADRIRAAEDEVLTAGRAIGRSSPADDLHQLRKDAKRLRYLLESFGRLGGRSRTRELIRTLKRLQDNLGAHQDAEVQAAWLREAVTRLDPDAPGTNAAIAAGERLAAVLEERQSAERSRFNQRFGAYDRKQTHQLFRELLRRMAS
jgi:CHAD domain-containing protein